MALIINSLDQQLFVPPATHLLLLYYTYIFFCLLHTVLWKSRSIKLRIKSTFCDCFYKVPCTQLDELVKEYFRLIFSVCLWAKSVFLLLKPGLKSSLAACTVWKQSRLLESQQIDFINIIFGLFSPPHYNFFFSKSMMKKKKPSLLIFFLVGGPDTLL